MASYVYKSAEKYYEKKLLKMEYKKKEMVGEGLNKAS